MIICDIFLGDSVVYNYIRSKPINYGINYIPNNEENYCFNLSGIIRKQDYWEVCFSSLIKSFDIATTYSLRFCVSDGNLVRLKNAQVRLGFYDKNGVWEGDKLYQIVGIRFHRITYDCITIEYDFGDIDINNIEKPKHAVELRVMGHIGRNA